MKFTTILPWLQPKIPLVKGILLYGNCEGLLLFRIKCLQKIYSHHHYLCSSATSSEEALESLSAFPGLFEIASSQKNIYLNNVTDALFNKGKIIETLNFTSHVFMASSLKLSSKSKLVSAFQESQQTALIPCYDSYSDEITQVCQWLKKINHLQMTPDALAYFVNFSIDNLAQFFSIFDLLILYAGQNVLDEKQLRNILSDFMSLPTEKFNEHFFLKEFSALNTLAQTFELPEWIRLIRLLIQDFMALLAFHSHHLKSSDLRGCWSKGVVKFPYPRLTLYEKAISQWNLQKCQITLASLLELERCIKSISPPTITQILKKLIELSRSD